MSRVGNASAAPVPDRPPIQEPPPSTGKDKAPEAPKGEPKSEPAPETSQTGNAEYDAAFAEAMADNAPKGDMTPEQQALQDLAGQMRASTSADMAALVGQAQNMGQDQAASHVQTTTTDAALQKGLDQASQQSFTQTRDTFQSGVSAQDSAARDAAKSSQDIYAGTRHAARADGEAKGAQADKVSQQVSKQSSESQKDYTNRMLKLSNPVGSKEFNARLEKQYPNMPNLSGAQQKLVKAHLQKQMQAEKLQQMMQQATSSKDKEDLKKLMDAFQKQVDNPDPETAAALKAAEEGKEAGEGKETEETDQAEKGKESGESEGAEGLAKFEQVDQGGQSGEGMGGQQGGAMDQGAQLPQVLPPVVDSNLSMMQTLERRDDVFTTGASASPEAQRSEQLGRMGARQAALLGMGAGETYRLHGSNGFHAIRMRYHGGGHSLDPQYQGDVGQANVEQGGVRVVGHRSGVSANIYQLGGAMRGVDTGQEFVTYRGQRWSTAEVRREMHAAAMVRGFHAASVTPGRTQSLGSYNAGMMA